MDKFLDRIRTWLRHFLGIHPACTLPENIFYQNIAHELMHTMRVFGSRDRVTLGRDVVLNDALINTSSGTVTIHDFAFFGHGVSLLTGTHDYALRDRERQTAVPSVGRDIIVGPGAWLGSNVTVLGPCMIGAHAVVAAGSVVVHDVDEKCVYAGTPARKIKAISQGPK